MKSLKNSRFFSFFAVSIIYVLATLGGIFTYLNLDFSWWISLLIADIAATVITFIFSVIFRNASVYDPYWSVQPPVILVAFALGKNLNLFGILLLIAVSFWAVRLTLNWAYTFKGLNFQDWRYSMLKEKTGIFYPFINFLGIHLVPTVVVFFCIIPAVYAVRQNLTLTIGGAAFICLSLFAVILQGTADFQMHKFRKTKNGTFIRNGLWKYSRHPNYLGEILMWWGIALSVVCSVPNALYLTLGALLNTALFFAVSIPLAEARQSKKEGYLEYKRQTRVLLPLKRIIKS